jgi:hypothetical protein
MRRDASSSQSPTGTRNPATRSSDRRQEGMVSTFEEVVAKEEEDDRESNDT